MTIEPAASAFDVFMDDCCRRVDRVLDEELPAAPDTSDATGAGGGAGGPHAGDLGELAAAMRHIVFSGGKRLRPALVLAGARDAGGDDDAVSEGALGAAAAVELIHAYSLLHDDLPCMDDGQLRRGKPCAHVIWGEALALLAGDALLTQAFEVLARRTPAGRPVGAMTAALGRAAGWRGMVGGQVLDLAAEGQTPEVPRVEAIHRNRGASRSSLMPSA